MGQSNQRGHTTKIKLDVISKRWVGAFIVGGKRWAGGGRGGVSRGDGEEEGLEGWELNMGHIELRVGTGASSMGA